MSHTKEAAQRKRRAKAIPVLGAASLSFSLASGAPAAVGGMNPDPTASTPVAQQAMGEEEFSEVSLRTFRVFGESSGTRQLRRRPTMVGAGACGIGLYYPQNPSALSGPDYQKPPPPRPWPIRPARKYKRS
jgi:hypothetical protein